MEFIFSISLLALELLNHTCSDFVTVFGFRLKHYLHPRLSAPVGGQIFTRVPVTEGYGQIFSGDLEFFNEDSIIIGG